MSKNINRHIDEKESVRELIESLKISQFDYPLPDDRIARHPLSQRDACKLLAADTGSMISHHHFSDLPDLLKPGSLMIANETRVINARLEFFKSSGARIEIFILEPFEPSDYAVAFSERERCVWTCLVGNVKKWKGDYLEKRIEVEGKGHTVCLRARLLAQDDSENPGPSRRVEFSWDCPEVSFAEIVSAAGEIPIPPYLKRDSEESDLTDYQTVYSRVDGSVAAPTAGLHFTPELFRRLESRGVRQRKVTLHVGAGTFRPVKSESIGEHPMHTESIVVDTATLREIISTLEEGREIIAVGTTSVRTIESLPLFGYLVSLGRDVSDAGAMHVEQWTAYEPDFMSRDTLTLLKGLLDALEAAGMTYLTGSTAIMISPGFRWRLTSRMVTNFHQPRSTLLLLVGSFLGMNPDPDPDDMTTKRERWQEVYDEALSHGYRFLSYGDACLFKGKELTGARPSGMAELPLSKSVALRALTLNAVSELVSGRSAFIPEQSDAGDVKGMERALSFLRFQLMNEANGGETENRPHSVNIGEGGAPFRFFTALAASAPGADVTLTVRKPLLRRPHALLIEALKNAGADIRCLRGENRPPLRIIGRKLDPKELMLNAGVSSQYISALMMSAPLWRNGLHLKFGSGHVVSLPYLRMTAEIMRRFGCDVTLKADEVIVSPDLCSAPERFEIPTDWSAASYFYELALLTPGNAVMIRRLTPAEDSMQGDSACAEIFGCLGVETDIHEDGSATLEAAGDVVGKLRSDGETFEIDLSGTPDLAPALAVGLCLSGIKFRFDNAGHLKHKETDRMKALAVELRKLGFVLWTSEDSMGWNGELCEMVSPMPEIETYSDHRMAMAFAPAVVRFPGLKIKNPEVVGKSFPRFWENLVALGLSPVKTDQNGQEIKG